MPAKEKRTGDSFQNQLKPEKVLITWTAPSRPFKRFSREFYITFISAAVLFAAILFAIDGVMPALLIAAVVFLFYVMNTVEPDDVEYNITDMGIKVAGNRTDWDNLGRFWFTNRFGTEIVVVEASNFGGRVELVLDANKKDEIVESLLKFSVYEEIPPSLFDKGVNWIEKRLQYK